MEKIIGIRREDKNRWERRTPLIPAHVKELKEKYGIKTIVQPSALRVFSDREYEEAGAVIDEDLSAASVVLAVKEIPMEMFQKDKTYVFFSHTIKGQDYNMPMLKRMMELECNLVDYERVVDDQNRRLIFFSRYAGIAGMIETLHAFGQKLKQQGYSTQLERIKQAYEYDSVETYIAPYRQLPTLQPWTDAAEMLVRGNVVETAEGKARRIVPPSHRRTLRTSISRMFIPCS